MKARSPMPLEKSRKRKSARKPDPRGPARADPNVAVEIAGVRLSHPDKVLYPDEGVTKRDLAQYYVAVAAAMLPHLRDRPLTMVRCPSGPAKTCFYQKHPSEGAFGPLQRVAIAEKEGRGTYLIANDLPGLIALVQMDVLEIHLWSATRRSLERPDRVIFDLDPDEGLAWERVGAAALTLRTLLAEMGLDSFIKATGGKGLHVVLPIAPRYGWDEIKLFARGVAQDLARRAPAEFTATLSKAARRGKIFIDYLRNQRGATAIAPYSARAKPTAPVAMPLAWAEVEQGWHSDRFTVKTLPDWQERLRRDPWNGFFALKQRLPASILRRLRAAGK